jgi:transposase InsO family protein
VLAASDFLTVEVWTGRGLVTHYLLFVISFVDRAVKIAGITTRPDESWMLQIARNVTDSQAGALHSKRYLIIDRDTKYSEQFRRLIRDAGTNVIRLPPRSPNLNAYAERFVRSIKDECLNRMIFIGQASLRRAVADYITGTLLDRVVRVFGQHGINVSGRTTTRASRQSNNRERNASDTRVAASTRLGFTQRSLYSVNSRRRKRFSASMDRRGLTESAIRPTESASNRRMT